MAGSSTVLVTGSAGRIGQAVVRELRARGHAVRGFDLVPTPGLDTSIVGDLSDGAAVRRGGGGGAGPVHLAATPDDEGFLAKRLPKKGGGGFNVLERARVAGG